MYTTKHLKFAKAKPKYSQGGFIVYSLSILPWQLLAKEKLGSKVAAMINLRSAHKFLPRTSHSQLIYTETFRMYKGLSKIFNEILQTVVTYV